VPLAEEEVLALFVIELDPEVVIDIDTVAEPVMDSDIEAVTVMEPDDEGEIDGDLELLPVTETMPVTVTDDEIEAEAETEDVLVPHAVVESEPLLDALTEVDILKVAETDTLDDMLPVTVRLPVVDGLADDDLHDVVVAD
jgi:hypothetical protein